MGDHPSGLALSPNGGTLYVANANSDGVSVIDTAGAKLRGEVKLAPHGGAPFGSMPNAVSVTPDGQALLVANGGNNGVAVVDAGNLRVRGLIPTAWFPSTVTTPQGGRFVYVTNMKGLGAGPNPNGPNPNKRNPTEQYVANMARGTPQVVALPRGAELAALTAKVVKNNGFDETRGVLTRTGAQTTPHAIPRRPGTRRPSST